MPGYHDVYVLARERSAAVATRFLAEFAPNGQASANEYQFPEYSDRPTVVFSTAAEAIRYCESHPRAEQRFYFCNPKGIPAHAMLFFTGDGGLILGLSVVRGRKKALSQLKEHADSDIGYMTFESPPVETVAEFRRVAATFDY